jgi:hypothetical protein
MVVATHKWPIAARVSLTLAMVGFRVAAVSPFGNLIRTVTAIEAHYPYSDWQGSNSIKRAIEAWSPNLIVCADDIAVYQLHLLHREASNAAGDANAQTLVDLIEASLGDPNSFATATAKSKLILCAQKIGVRCPSSTIIADYHTLKKEIDCAAYPIVIKADGSFGGRAVRVVTNRDSAWKGIRELVLPFLWSGPAKRLFGKMLPCSLVVRLLKERTLCVQDHITGRNSNRAVACWNGEVLAGVSVVAIETLYPQGPATVIQIIDNPEMTAAAANLVKCLKLSGFIGFDFILDAANQAWLLEMNPRVTPISHLCLADGTSLPGAIFSKMTGAKPNGNASTVKENTIALFPQEVRRSDRSEYLVSCYHDVPWSEPKFVHACLSLRFGRGLLKRQKRWLSMALTRNLE